MKPLGHISRGTANWWIAAGVTLVLILVPFFAIGDAMEAWVSKRLAIGDLIAPLVIGSLALDPVLPIPSSIVSLAAGAQLGFWAGWSCIWAGMSLGSLFGYALGRNLLRRSMPTASEARPLSADGRALWMLALTRPIPVLAEATTILLGVRAMPITRFLAVSAAANAVVGAMYAAAGGWVTSLGSLPLIVAVLILLSSVPWLGYRLLRHQALDR